MNSVKGIAAGALAAMAVAFAASAAAVPSGPPTVDRTVNQLQANGFHVILNKVGAGPLERCSVTSVRRGQTFERTDSGAPGAGRDLVTTVASETVYVDVIC